MKIDEKLNRLSQNIEDPNPDLDEVIFCKALKANEKTKNHFYHNIVMVVVPLLLLLLIPMIWITSGVKNDNHSETPTESILPTNPDNKTDDRLTSVLLQAAKTKKKVDYNASTSAEFKDFIRKVNRFAAELTTRYYQENLNSTYSLSPSSIFNVLCMILECTDGNTAQEIMDVIGLTREEIITYYPLYQEIMNKEKNDEAIVSYNPVKTAEYRSNNAIWYDQNIKFNDGIIETLSEKYYADNYQANFKDEYDAIADEIIDYINQKTNNLLNPKLKLSPETILTFVNTIYIYDIWSASGLNINQNQTKFTNYDLTTTKEAFFDGLYSYGNYGQTDKMRFYYNQTNSYFKITFMLPKDGYQIHDIYDVENINLVTNYTYERFDDVNMIDYRTRTIMPKFNVGGEVKVKKTLMAMGIEELFQFGTANFNRLTTSPAYISDIYHEARVKADQKGLSGAAVTIAPVANTGMPDNQYRIVYQDFIVDKAFAYIITDNYNNIIFTGVVNKI